MKLALLCCVLAASPAAAQTRAGNSVLSLGLGLGAPLSGLDLGRFGGGSEAPGDLGVAVSPQFLHHVSPHAAWGAELTYMDFPDRTVSRRGSNLTVDGSLLTIEGVGRYLFSPQSRVTPYLIGGLGFSEFSARVREASDPGDVLLNDSAVGLALSTGAGVQASLTPSLLAMGEVLWRFATSDSDKFGTGMVNALSFLLRLGWKF